MHVLVLSADPSLVSTFSEISREFEIETQSINDQRLASDQLNRAKYAGLLVDLDTVSDTRPFIASVNTSACNKTAVVFAVATKLENIDKALDGHAHFVLRRPVQPQAIRKTLRTAYDLLSGKQRRDFRHTANLSVSITSIVSGDVVDGSTLNVSSNGVAVVTPEQLKVAEATHIVLELPDGFMVHATGVVIWSDDHGKAGLHFQCVSPQMREKLDAWLDSQFAQLNARAAHS